MNNIQEFHRSKAAPELPLEVYYECVEACSEAIMITDHHRVLKYINPAWTTVYGYSSTEAIGQTPAIIHSNLQDDEFYKDMWQDILDPNIGYWKGELVNRAKNGELIPVILTITGFGRDDEGKALGYLGIAIDNRPQKQMEKEVLRQDRLASIGYLASGLSHEIGTPLGVIRGRAELLQLKCQNDPSIDPELQIIIQQADRISQQITSLLRFTRSPDQDADSLIPFQKVVDESVPLIQEKLHRRDIHLKVDIEKDLKLRANSSSLVQVMVNLLVNAIHAISSATLEEPSRSHQISIGAKTKPKGLIEIKVRDTGCGIPSENLGKLFLPFFTTKDIGEGTGLGLSIVSKIVQDARGSIHVDSKLGKGTTFTMTFPAPEKLSP